MNQPFDIMSSFAKLAEKIKREDERISNRGSSYPRELCEMCWNQGSFLGKMIPDSNGIPLRTISDCHVGFLPVEKDDGTGTYNKRFCICSIDNYECPVTQDQKNLYNKIIDAININNKYSEECEVRPQFSRIPRATIFYMMIRTFLPESGDTGDYTNPRVTLMLHRSYNFTKSLTDSISKRTEMMGKSWTDEYFNREVGKCFKMTMITTSRPAVGYEIKFDFIENPQKVFDVEQDHIDKCDNLNKELIDITKFDEEYHKEILDKLTKINNDLDKLDQPTEYVRPTENKNAV